jgi:hypothetical protein
MTNYTNGRLNRGLQVTEQKNIHASSPLPVHTIQVLSISTTTNMRGWDIYYGGAGYIAGTVKIGGVGVARKLRLMDSRNGIVIRTTESNADGTYSFTYLSTGVYFDVLAIDDNGVYNSVIATWLKAAN